MITAVAIEFFALGTPRTKGSLRPIHNKHADGTCTVSLREQGGFDLQHWRDAVSRAAAKAMDGQMPYTGPVAVVCSFTFLPVAGARPGDYVATVGRHDLDKLERAVLDSLTDAAVWKDDGQVAVMASSKRYGEMAGARIEVTPL